MVVQITYNAQQQMSFPLKATGSHDLGIPYRIRAYYDDEHFITSEDFFVSQETEFLQQPTVTGEIDEFFRREVSWEVSFIPKKYEVYQWFGEDHLIVLLTYNAQQQMSFPLKAASSQDPNLPYRIRAYYDDDHFITSEDFYVTKETVFLQQPTVCRYSEEDEIIPVDWTVSFQPLKIVFQKKLPDNGGYATQFSMLDDLSENMVHGLPAAESGETYRICAYYTQDNFVASQDFSCTSRIWSVLK